MKYNPRYPFKHLSVRVPWHDNGWNGTICTDPKGNSSCLALKNCALNRDDEKEEKFSGVSIQELDEVNFPVCVGERGTFMSDFSFIKTLEHPYTELSKSTHGHLRPTKVRFPAYSVAAVPYHWMLIDNAREKARIYDLDFDEHREPDLDWKDSNTNWVQEIGNQKSLMNCFLEHLEEEASLVFIYAKQVPFVESSGRVLIGVGRVKKIIESKGYEGSNNRFGAAYWENMVLHSIRNDHKDGFLLPYHGALEYQNEHSNFDPASLAVIVPNDKNFEFSYASEHVGNDTAIRILLECSNSIKKAQELGIGENHTAAMQWIHNEISKLEKLRGFYPGMGSVLCAFGIEKGHFIAADIINSVSEDEEEDPWDQFEKSLENPEDYLSENVSKLIPHNSRLLYQKLKQKATSSRIKFLHLLSRFDISIEQATVLFVQEEREKMGMNRKDSEYLENPYLIYEDLRRTNFPIAIETLDFGLFIKRKSVNIKPDNLIFDDPLSLFRIRALTISELEKAANVGHTLLPRKQIVNQIRELPLEPNCPVNSDYFELAEEVFAGVIANTKMKNEERAYQLNRFDKCKKVIGKIVKQRVEASRFDLQVDWSELIAESFDPFTKGKPDHQELTARKEKKEAVEEIASSRFSVLIGPAGTGKTTLLTILAGHKEIQSNGVLLLAPTGKARVRMEEIAKNIQITAKTLAQFLAEYGRYDGNLQQYKFSNNYCDGLYQTVILDESSMLTEEMLATTLDCLKGVKRFILVGDHRQLPPIGAGRPFMDVIQYLKPEDIEIRFPRIGTGYAELTIKRRQGGNKREDLQLAEWFSGEQLEPGADEIISQIISNENSEYLRLEPWANESEFEFVFNRVLKEELGLDSIEDAETFNKTLGSPDGRYFNFRDAVNKIEDWQILSPVRQKEFGVRAINRKIHKQFRKEKINYANSRYGKIPKPLGLEEIVYGDKIINLSNSKRYHKTVWPKDGLNYIANGEIGVVIGQFKQSYHKFRGKPKNTEIEFTSQKGYKYTFKSYEFKEEGDVPLELAYALTVHKSQGSEFDKVFLIVPNPCFLLTREMLYTALTRQKSRVIVLFQGDVFDIKGLASPLKSDTLKRITNLFKKPELVEVEGAYLEKNLIHQASDGKMLRSKSELLIYQRLIDKGLRPVYEQRLVIKDVEKLPDFTIENDNTGEIYYWEHCGMMHDSEYVQRWEDKYNWYRENEIIPYEEGGGKNGTLIVTEDKPQKLEDGSFRGAISVKEIDELIDQLQF